MSDQKVKIVTIELEMKDGLKISLPIEEARAFYNELNKIFGVTTYPIIIDRSWWPHYYTWTSSGSTASALAVTDSGSTITWNCESK